MRKIAFILQLTCCCLFAGFSNAQTPGSAIVLKDKKVSVTPSKFYIANIGDARTDRNSVALLIQKNSTMNVDLKNGAVEAIKNFLNHNLKCDTTLQPVMLTIKEFKLIEHNQPRGTVSGQFKIVFSFSEQLSYKTAHLIDYSGVFHYSRPNNKPKDVDALLRRGIENGLSYFNNWFNEQKKYTK